MSIQTELNMPSIRLKEICLLILIFGLLFFTLLGNRPLFVPDEGRYAEIAREMVESGDYLIPHLNGILYFEKPPLFYWLSSLSFKLFGIHVAAIRAINALLGALGCLLTYVIASKLYDQKIGFFSALILASSLLYFTMAHMVTLDMAVTFFITGALYAYLIGFKETHPLKRRGYFYLTAIAMALAVLTKGLIGILFPISIIVCWLFFNKHLSKPFSDRAFQQSTYLPSSIILFLLLTLPWHLIVQHTHPEFLHFYIVEHHFLRYTDLSIGHNEPIWFFIPYLLLGFLPWTFFLLQTIRMQYQTWRKKEPSFSINLYFIIWVLFIFIFFSFSKSKLIPYILPLFPALSILTAQYVVRFKENHCMLGILFTIAGLLTLLFYAPHMDHRTIFPLAKQLKHDLKLSDWVITYNQYYQDLPFYLGRKVAVLNWKNELAFGMAHQKTNERMINDATFFRRWHSQKQIYVIISQSEYDAFKKAHPNDHAIVLGKTKTNYLITNRAPQSAPLDLLSH